MLFQHDPAEPIGVWLELPEVMRSRELLALIKAGAIDGLSIGFKTVRGRVRGFRSRARARSGCGKA